MSSPAEGASWADFAYSWCVAEDIIIVVDLGGSSRFLCWAKIVVDNITVSEIVGIALLRFRLGSSRWREFLLNFRLLVQSNFWSKWPFGQFEPALEFFWFGSNRLDPVGMRRRGRRDWWLARYGEVRWVICRQSQNNQSKVHTKQRTVVKSNKNVTTNQR